MTARVSGVGAQKAPLSVRVAYFFTRRALSKMSGSQPERMLEPLEIMAKEPRLLSAHGRLEQAIAKLDRLDVRLRDLAELKAATVVGCEYCIDLGSQIARRRSGVSDDELRALRDHRSSGLFSELEQLILDYAAAISRSPSDVPDELFKQLREYLDETQLVELAYIVAHANARGRFNRTFGIGAAGFCSGPVCALPESSDHRQH